MKKKSFIKKIKEKTSEFFEEEDDNEEEEINLKTLIIIFLIGFIILLSIYSYTNRGFGFLKFGLDETEDIEQDNEEEEISEISDYFEDYLTGKNILENSDFSEGMNHWSTSDGGELYKYPISKRTLNKEDYHSPPQSLQTDCSEISCRIHYDTEPRSIIIDNPYGPKSGTWISIKPGTKLKISYWYKGSKHKFYLFGLDNSKEREIFGDIWSDGSTEWIEKKLFTIIEEGITAIGIEITMNSEGTLLVDDIQLEIPE